MGNQPDYEAAQKYALDRLENELSPKLVYHSVAHTVKEVVPAVQRLATMQGILGESFALLETAAYFHDLGFIKQCEGHEAISMQIAQHELPAMGFSDEQIQVISGIIKATELPQQPNSSLEEIMADADLDMLGQSDFFSRSQDLRVELASFGETIRTEQWYIRELHLLRSHRYFTASARLLRDAQKRHNLQDLQSRLERLRAPQSSSPELIFNVGKKNLSTQEVVAILRSVSIFAESNEEVLVEVVNLLKSMEYPPNQTIIRKGELGDCMYMIIDGRVKIFDGERTLNVLGAGDVFGEMALLDTEPRMASVATLEITHLLRLDQSSFYGLMSTHPEVPQGVIRVLLRHLRSTVKEVR